MTNLVGVDIGCGMIVAELGKVYVDPIKLEHLIVRDISYKPMESILKQIGPTALVERIVRPVYNYKAH